MKALSPMFGKPVLSPPSSRLVTTLTFSTIDLILSYHTWPSSLNLLYIPVSMKPQLHNYWTSHGFRPGKSSITSSNSFTTYILNSFEANSQVDTIFTDFKKAFDSVDHGLLIATLDSLGIGHPLISWLTSYLTSRRQFVKLNGAIQNYL